MQVLLFFQEGMMRVDRDPKSDVQSALCYFLNKGHNHSPSAVNVIKASTGGICYTGAVVWTVSMRQHYRCRGDQGESHIS